ncbi:MAG: hypothetical protein GY696_01210 [Gammaproteobacteria bacterium]|nr:hypothetical protein [Gammaproteobacteria bacterium]
MDQLALRGELDKLALRGSGTSGAEHSTATTNTTTTTLHTSDTILCSSDIVNESLDAMINQSSVQGCRDAGGGGISTLRSRDLSSTLGAAAPRDTLLEAPPAALAAAGITGSHTLLQHRDMGGRTDRIQESRNFTLSPETTDCDSADLESELSLPGITVCILVLQCKLYFC